MEVLQTKLFYPCRIRSWLNIKIQGKNDQRDAQCPLQPSLLSLLSPVVSEFEKVNAFFQATDIEAYTMMKELSIYHNSLKGFSKVLKRFMYSQFYDHVSHESHLITPHQHGFLRYRSCVTQLLCVLHSIGQKLDKNEQTDIVYLDFAKAFDSVDHSILLQKLKCYGVTGSLLNWIADYPKYRRQSRSGRCCITVDPSYIRSHQQRSSPCVICRRH